MSEILNIGPQEPRETLEFIDRLGVNLDGKKQVCDLGSGVGLFAHELLNNNPNIPVVNCVDPEYGSSNSSIDIIRGLTKDNLKQAEHATELSGMSGGDIGWRKLFMLQPYNKKIQATLALPKQMHLHQNLDTIESGSQEVVFANYLISNIGGLFSSDIIADINRILSDNGELVIIDYPANFLIKQILRILKKNGIETTIFTDKNGDGGGFKLSKEDIELLDKILNHSGPEKLTEATLKQEDFWEEGEYYDEHFVVIPYKRVVYGMLSKQERDIITSYFTKKTEGYLYNNAAMSEYSDYMKDMMDDEDYFDYHNEEDDDFWEFTGCNFVLIEREDGSYGGIDYSEHDIDVTIDRLIEAIKKK